MKITHKECRKILDNLKNGNTYGAFITCPDGRKVCDGDFFIGTGYNFTQYIYFSHYGSSAVKVNERDLYWLINTIFKSVSYIAPVRYSYQAHGYVEI